MRNRARSGRGGDGLFQIKKELANKPLNGRGQKMDEYAVKRNLRKGLQLYQDNKNRLASMRDENGQLPDALRHRQTELANQRQQWLSTIEELKATGVLEEREGEKLKAKFLD
jgi:hypothetical protein